MNIPPKFDKTQADVLRSFLSSPQRLSGSMSYCEAVGFLFVVACAPEMVNPSEWMPIILEEGEFDEQEMESVEESIGSLMALYNELNRQVQEKEVSLITGCKFHSAVLDNFDRDAPMSQWCNGFVVGQQWLAEMWDEYVPEELAEEFGAQMMVLSFFADREIADEILAESERPDRSMEEMAAGLQSFFPQAMASFALLGGSIQSVLRERAQQPVRREKIGRNDPCHCGSGKKYKKCCALKLH